MTKLQATLKFEKACALLKELAEAGYHTYLAADSFNLMIGPSHDPTTSHPLKGNSIASISVRGAGGGDW